MSGRGKSKITAVIIRRSLLGIVFIALALLSMHEEALIQWLSEPEVRVGLAIVFLILPVLLVLSWNRSLKRKVAQQTQALQEELKHRQRTELALKESQENLAITLNSIGDGVIATDVEGRITRLNSVAEIITQWTSHEAKGKNLTDIFKIRDPERGPNFFNPVEAVLERGMVVNLGRDTILVARDGSEHLIADSAAPIRNPEGDVVGVVLVFQDVTEQRELEEQFMQAQKMESVGRLAGGVAHDFNNLLSGIIGYAELLKGGIDSKSPNHRYATTIINTANRAVDLTQQLLAFSRKKTKKQDSVNVHKTISEVIDLLSRTIDRRITIQQELTAKNTCILGDASQIQSTLMNLGVNARDAMPEGGQLRFTTRNCVLDHAFCRRHGQKMRPGPYLEITVGDTGVGMNKKVLSNIFEPFFTTKGDNKGTGLGLAMVYSTLQKHGGGVDVHSIPDKGTTFSLYFPTCSSSECEGEKAATFDEAPGGTGHILLVDDEVVVRNIASEVLSKLGYRVSVVSDGMEAVEFYRNHHGDIDLVLLDLIMPKKNGQDTYMDMRKINPASRVVIMSGFSADQELKTLETQGILGFLPKPFTATTLSQKVAECLKNASIDVRARP